MKALTRWYPRRVFYARASGKLCFNRCGCATRKFAKEACMLMFPLLRQISDAWRELRASAAQADGPEAGPAPHDTRADELTTIASFDRPTDAYIAQGRLAAEGIRAQLFDDHMTQMDGLYAFALTGIRLQVRPRDAQDAQRILATDYSHDLDDVDVGKPDN